MRPVRKIRAPWATLRLTKAVSSCGLDMSVGAAGFVPLGAAGVAPLGEEELVDGRDGVTAGVTFKGRAAEDGGGMVGPVCGDQCARERHVGWRGHAPAGREHKFHDIENSRY